MLVDIGNSRIKYTANETPFLVAAITHNHIDKLTEQLTLSNTQHVLLSNGRSQSANDVSGQLNTFCQQHSINVTNVAIKSDLLTINYQDTEQFGIDRYLNLLAAANRYHHNFCVISCGTALTLDFYTDEHIGGMILPGLGISRQLLIDKTGLQDISRPESLLGNDTASSIGAGIYIGLQNLIYSSIERIEAQQLTKFTIILTGGDAEVLHERGIIIDTLLLEGMQYYSNHTRDTNEPLNPK